MNPSREQMPPMRPVLSVGRYSLFGELATGGMATVHFGRMYAVGGFNKTVAIKRMRREIGMDPEFVAMFLDEARLTSRIEHPNVVATIDVVAEAGEVFLVMEYVRGESLERLRRAARSKRENIPVNIAVGILCGALAGLHAAHEAVGEDGTPLGIIHRDVSPQNILVGEDGVARITDFGIAKAESRLQVTQDGQMKGKLPYMAPEQLSGRSQRLDRRVDVFSAATVLWELIAGRMLFRADHPGETIAKVLSAPIPSLSAMRADVPPALDYAIRRALSRPPGERPATAEAFAISLEEAIGFAPASARAVGAWVASLANEVLESRTKYVREMESVSQVDIRHPGEAAASAPQVLAAAAEAGARMAPAVSPPSAAAPVASMAASAGVFGRPAGPVAGGPPTPTAEESSYHSAVNRPLGLDARPVGSLDALDYPARSGRSMRMAIVLGGAAFAVTALVVFIIVAVIGSRGGDTAGASASPGVSSAAVDTPPSVPLVASAPPPNDVLAADASTDEPAAVVTAAPTAADPAGHDSTSTKGAAPPPTGTKPPVATGAPTRPYLPDLP